MNPTLETLQYSADLTKRMGNASCPNGKSVREMLSIEGISLWDIVTPILAVNLLSADITRQTLPNIFNRICWPYLSLMKQRAKSFIPFSRGAGGCSLWPAEPVCLLLGFSGYMYRDVLEPVKAYFDENSEMNCVVLHDDGRFHQSAVKISGKGVQSIWQHWDSSVNADEKMAFTMLAKVLKEVKTDCLWAVLDAKEKREIWPKIEPTFKWLWMVCFPSLIPYFVLAKHILNEHPNAIIISPDQADPRIRLFRAIGQLYSIPSLEVQFGLYGKECVEWQFFASDKIAVWGNTSRQVLLDHGVPDDSVTVSGSPRFDNLANINDDQVLKVRTRLGIPTDRAMVLLASHPSPVYYNDVGNSPYTRKSVKRAIFQAADKLPGMTLVVKPHPLEDMEETKKSSEGCKNIIFVDRSEDIRELTKACDVFITLGSTATMDAIVARKLVVYPSFPGFVWWDDLYLEGNVSVVVKSEEELVDKLYAAVSGKCDAMLDELEPARRIFLNNYVYQSDGQSTARIAALARKMARV